MVICPVPDIDCGTVQKFCYDPLDKGIKVYYLSDEELASYRKEVSDYYFAQEDWVKDLDMDFYNSIANMEY